MPYRNSVVIWVYELEALVFVIVFHFVHKCSLRLWWLTSVQEEQRQGLSL